MNKKYMLTSLILGMAFILAACAGGAPSGTEFPGLTEEPGLPGSDQTQVAPMETSETPMATEEVTSPTVEPGQGITNTEGVTSTEGIPATGMIDPGLASNLPEFNAVTKDGERVGETGDLVLDLQAGTITYLVVKVEGNLIPVPWALVTFAAPKADAPGSTKGPQNDFELAVDLATLQGAPSFKMGEFPDTQSPDWDAEIQAYWKEYLPNG